MINSTLPTPFEARVKAEEQCVVDWMSDYPMATLREFAEAWGCAASTVKRLLDKYGYTYIGTYIQRHEPDWYDRDKTEQT